jgi:hypothetical protein
MDFPGRDFQDQKAPSRDAGSILFSIVDVPVISRVNFDRPAQWTLNLISEPAISDLVIS